MNKWLLMVGALLLTACSSGVENKSYYQLPLASAKRGTKYRQSGKPSAVG